MHLETWTGSDVGRLFPLRMVVTYAGQARKGTGATPLHSLSRDFEMVFFITGTAIGIFRVGDNPRGTFQAFVVFPLVTRSLMIIAFLLSLLLR